MKHSTFEGVEIRVTTEGQFEAELYGDREVSDIDEAISEVSQRAKKYGLPGGAE